MAVWLIDYFPPEGDNDSPLNYIFSLEPVESAKLLNRLEILAEKELHEWPSNWYHHIEDKIFQIKRGDHRMMYCLDDGCIVVLHAFRKRSQKTKSSDIHRAKLNYKSYIQQTGRGL